MKTLSEEINEIKNAKMSKAAKRTALAKLGLIASDVEIIMSNMPAPESRGSRCADVRQVVRDGRLSVLKHHLDVSCKQ